MPVLSMLVAGCIGMLGCALICLKFSATVGEDIDEIKRGLLLAYDQRDRRTEEGRCQPKGAAADDLGPVPAPPGEDDERFWYLDGDGLVMPLEPGIRAGGVDIDDLKLKCGWVIAFGPGEEAQFLKIGEHAYLVHGCSGVSVLETAEKVSLLARMFPNLEKEGEQIERSCLHVTTSDGDVMEFSLQ